MAGNKKPRKRYNPTKWLERAVKSNEKRADARPLEENRQTDLGIAFRIAFEQMLRGGDEHAWCTRRNYA